MLAKTELRITLLEIRNRGVSSLFEACVDLDTPLYFLIINIYLWLLNISVYHSLGKCQ